MQTVQRARAAGLGLALVASCIVLGSPLAAFAQGQVLFDTKGVSDKPQSKLWYHNNYWWACINNTTKMTIYKIDGTTWTPKFDVQNAVTPSFKGGTCDVKWDGTNLFVAVLEGTVAKIYKLTFNSATETFAIVSGFPKSLTMPLGTETVVLEKDSTGRLWVTFEAESKIYVMYSTSADHKTWVSTPLAIGSPVDPDDISTIVTFGGRWIGVAWSDQRGQKVSFRWHADASAPTSWSSIETVRAGFGVIDDHLNMKSDSSGRIYLVAKDYFDGVWIARRDPGAGWTVTTGASGLDCGTRPILQIDESQNKLYVFYTRWEACVSGGTHAIEERVAYLDNLLFSLPAVVIAQSSVSMNEVQGTKQVLPPGSLAVVCEGSNGKAYWTGWGPVSGIGGSDPGGQFPPPPLPPTNLASAEVTESSTSRLVLWRMDEGTGAKADDGSGGGHTLNFATGIAAPQWTEGVMNGGLFFNGDAYATTSGTGLEFVGTSFTLEAWVKCDLTNSSSTGMIFAKADSLKANYELSITDEQVRFEWSIDDTTGVSVKATGTLRDNAWHHVAAVWDQTASEGRIYIDGVLKGSKITLGPAVGGSWPVSVGALVQGPIVDKTFSGAIDLAAIASEAVYNGDFVPPLLYPSSSTRYVRVTWNPSSSIAGILGYALQRAVNDGTPADLLTMPTPNAWFADFAPPDGFVDYHVRAVDGLRQSGSDAVVRITWESDPPALPTSPLGLAWESGTVSVDGPAFWEFDEGAGASVPDGTGLGHELQLGSSAAGDAADPAWIWGYSGTGLRFDGSNDFAQAPDAGDLRLTGSFTVEAWVRRGKLGGTQAILSKGDASSKRNYALTILSNGTVEFSWSKTSGSSRKVISSVAITDLEQWHHVAGVYDQPTETSHVYVDGVAAGTAGTSGTPYTGAQPLLLGARNSSSKTDWFNGTIDLVRISNFRRYTESFTPPDYYRGSPKRHVLELSWGLPASGLVESYDIYRQPLPSGTNTRIGSTDVTKPAFIDVNVTQGSSYRYTIRALNSAGDDGPASAPLDVTVPLPTDAVETAPAVPGPRLRLEPNPFNPQAQIRFRLDATGPVRLDLYDARGRRLDTLVDAVLPAGVHRVPILRPQAALRLSSGVYFLRLRADGQETRLKAVLLK